MVETLGSNNTTLDHSNDDKIDQLHNPWYYSGSMKEALEESELLKSKRRAMPHLRNTDGRMLPNYQRTRKWLVDYISEHKLEAGNKLPSERDLASDLGLSRSTVARAVSELIKDGVLVRKNRVGTYVGGAAPRQSSTHTGTIGIIMPWLSPGEVQGGQVGSDNAVAPVAGHSISSQILQGVIPVLKEAGYRLVLHSNSSVSDEIDLARNLSNEGLDGAIIVPTVTWGTERIYMEVARSGLPVVLLDRYFPNCPLDRVVTDNYVGAMKAVEYLIERGHTRIAHFTSFDCITSIIDRQSGYRAALENAGIVYDEDIVCGPQLLQQKQWDVRYALEHCLRMPDPITAVFCLNDNAIMATLQAANKLGVRIPEDLTVAGFFDYSMPVGMEIPFIRVVQNKIEMGRAAAKLLLERIAGDKSESPRHILVPAELKPSFII